MLPTQSGGGGHTVHLAQRSVRFLEVVLAKAFECPSAGRAGPRNHGRCARAHFHDKRAENKRE